MSSFAAEVLACRRHLDCDWRNIVKGFWSNFRVVSKISGGITNKSDKIITLLSRDPGSTADM